MLLFWAGLKRRAVHAVTNKQPLALVTVRDALTAGAAAWPLCQSPGSSFSEAKPHLLVLRAAASTAIAFFGIRRLAELPDSLVRHVTFDDSGAAIIAVPRQKNDQLGKGQSAAIPPFPS